MRAAWFAVLAVLASGCDEDPSPSPLPPPPTPEVITRDAAVVGVTDPGLQAVLLEDWDIAAAWAVEDPPPDADALYARMAANLEAARAIDRDALSPDDRLTLDVYVERQASLLAAMPCWRDDEVAQHLRARRHDTAPTDVRAHVVDHDRPDTTPGCYQALIRFHTSTDLSAEEIHQIGLDELVAIEAEIAALGARMYGVTTLAEIRARADADPAQRYRSEDEIERAAERLVDEAIAASAPVFASLPAYPLRLTTGGASAAYNGPSSDTAFGEYLIATDPVEGQRRYQLAAVTLHEAIPGHHLERSRQYERRDLPWSRRAGGDTIYIEGWAFYTEYLAEELGMYRDDAALLGALSNRALRAARLVVDTGLHALGWDRARAVAFLTEHTLEPPYYVDIQVTRYIHGPGQALAYMLGAREILRLRAGAEARLGDRFSLRDFHERVLGDGSLPLRLLTSRMEAWIADQVR